jgi:phage shock protein PspC (stress-responsive transcriptional regulator)
MLKIDNMKSVRGIIELHAFGVCALIGEKMGIASTRIRMWFIYISFLTFGSPLIIYMVLAFWINIKNYIYSARRNPLRYL